MSSFDVNTILNDKFFTFKWFNPSYLFAQMSQFFHFITPYIFNGQNVNVFRLILSFLSMFFIVVIAYSTIRILEVREKEHKHLHHEIAEYAEHQAEKQKKGAEVENVSKNERWNNVLLHLFSQNLSDWKLAIIEADSMLESLLDQLGFAGDTLGDKLKVVDKDKFRNLASAWEVHTIRNRIAHEGLAFEISQQEAKRVIALYEQIFRDYGYI